MNNVFKSQPRVFDIDPDDEADFGIDWTDWLTTNETIATSTWTVPSGITKTDSQKEIKRTFIWVKGATVGNTYKCENKIVTDSTPVRTFIDSIYLKCVEK